MSHCVVISENPDTDYHEREVMPKKRTRTFAWYIVCVLAAVGILFYGLYNSIETKFYPTGDLYASIAQNKTPTCYLRVEKKTYPVFISLGLGVLGILLAPAIRCLCDFVDELCQHQSWCKGNIFKLFKACFSGISWKSVIVVAIIDGIALLIRQTLSLNDVMFILGGIGVGPLVTILLDLNAPTQVNRSRHHEKEKSSPPYTLAWIYYFHFLPEALLAFSSRFSYNDSTVRLDNCSDKEQLDLNKLILLFSANFEKGVQLSELDNHIRKINDVNEGKYKFSIYGLKYKNNEYNFVILHAEEQLEILKGMCKFEACKPVYPGQVQEQVKLMFRTVCEYLKTDDHPRKCIPVLVSAAEGFENGGLVKQIMFSVQRFVTEKKSVTEEESPAVTGPTTPVDVRSDYENSSLLQNRSLPEKDSSKSRLSRIRRLRQDAAKHGAPPSRLWLPSDWPRVRRSIIDYRALPLDYDFDREKTKSEKP